MEGVSLLLIGFALGIDSFSVSLSLGLQKISYKRMLFICFIFSFFHMVFPLIGIAIGAYLLQMMQQVAYLLSGFLLCTIGTMMLYAAYTAKQEVFKQPRGIYLLAIGVAVSLDSLSIGMGVGLYQHMVFPVILLFGLMTGIMSFVGLLLGGKVHTLFGKYSEFFGGLILLFIGLKEMMSVLIHP